MPAVIEVRVKFAVLDVCSRMHEIAWKMHYFCQQVHVSFGICMSYAR